MSPAAALCLRALLLAAAAGWFALSGAIAHAAEQAFFLKNGQTIVFFGDSITQGGTYVAYVESYLRTRFPEQSFRIINSGISSETISGTSEADHNPRRPYAHLRFDRDVAAHKPSVVVACFGMNDGNYHPFESERFRKYQAGVHLLAERTKAAGGTLVLMTPPPFDPYRRKAGDDKATEYGYKFPAIDYDTTLEVYSHWLVRLRDAGLVVADVHTRSNAHLAARRKSEVSFFLAGDAVHPNATGHALMAFTLLEAWQAPAVADEAAIDIAAKKATRGAVSDLSIAEDRVAFRWKSQLPMPFDPAWDPKSIALEGWNERLSRYTLAVAGLTAAKNTLVADGQSVGSFSREELAAGIDLNAIPAWPTTARAAAALELIKKQRQAIYQAWRKAIADPNTTDSSAAVQAAETAAAEMEHGIQKLCMPHTIEIELRAE